MNDISCEQWNYILVEYPVKGVMLLTINRPQSLNALNEAIFVELAQVLDHIEADGDCRVLLITGAGDRSFVAGADIKYMRTLNPIQSKAFSQLGTGTFRRLERLHIPVVALVNGYALGGGCELAMSCDCIIASDNAVFGQPEVNLGITPGFGGSQRLTRLVGRGMAIELLVTGRTMSAEEALQRGLVNHVYPQSDLRQKGLELAGTISSKSKTAVQLSKQLVQRGQDIDLDNACSMESDVFALSFATDDKHEGMTAFVERRSPRFR